MIELEYCPITSKRCYSQRKANDIIRSVKRGRKKKQPKLIPQRSYMCDYCGTYHLTHLRRYNTCKVTAKKSGMRDSSRFRN